MLRDTANESRYDGLQRYDGSRRHSNSSSRCLLAGSLVSG
ncbi:hypothetical protein WANA31_0369 [Wolbachia endosymbiont of Drosophila ananassae]|nr:hypothetical protein WANA31_0369 [Wolbachia endosymbiont of Drosophila ananassae]